MKHEFKKGDWVVPISVIDENGSYYKYACNNVNFWKKQIGKAVKINFIQKSQSTEKNVYWIMTDGSTDGITSNQIRPALPHEIPGNQQKYEVGGYFEYNQDGSMYKILSLNPFKCKSEWSDLEYGDHNDYPISWFMEKHKDKYTYIPPSNKQEDFDNEIRKEIFYNEIFNENNNQLNNNKNGKTENNDLFGKNFSGNGSKEAATAISFRRTSKIATSSGYTGNKIQGRRVDTKIGRSEINFSAISI